MFADGLVEIHQHHDADFDGNACKRNKAHANSDRQVVSEQVEQPEAANEGHGQRADDDGNLCEPTEIEIQQQNDNRECYRTDNREALFRTHHVLVLARPR